MSSLEGPSTYRSEKSGGYVRIETSNRALLALLHENSSANPGAASANVEATSPHAVVTSPHRQSSGFVDKEEDRSVTGFEALSSRRTSAWDDNSDFLRAEEKSVGDNARRAPAGESKTDASGVTERRGHDSFLPAQQLGAETAATSSERDLPGNPASVNSSADVGVKENAEGRWSGDGGDVEGSAGLDVPGPGLTSENGHPGGLSELDRGQAKDAFVSTLGVSSDVSTCPDGGSDEASSLTPLSLPVTSPRAAGSNNPEHPRFVTPYSSRRLKDTPGHKRSAVGTGLVNEQRVQTSLNASEDPDSNREQAARLRAGGRGITSTGSVPHAVQHPVSSLQETTHVHALSDAAADQIVNIASRQEEPLNQNARHREEAVRSSESPISDRDWAVEGKHPLSLHQGSSWDHKLSHPTDVSQGGHSDSPDPAAVDTRPLAQRPGDVTQQVLPSPSPRKLHPLTADESGVERVFVDSPTFTQEEEEEYRFVSSRIEDEEDPPDHHLTYRGLDLQALKKMDGTSTASIQPPRKPFKQVRYQDDEDRFEDREDFLQYNAATERRGQSPEIQTQYVLKSKNGSGKTAVNQPPQPVRSLTLPSGPSYDPQDEEDLKREASYQQELKSRVDTTQRTAESTVIPQVPRDPEGEDWLAEDEMEANGPRYQHHRDSLSMYEGQRLPQNMHSTQWEDPPPVPHHGFGQPQGYSRAAHIGFADQGGQGYANSHRPGYAMIQAADYGETYHRDRYEEAHYAGPPAASHSHVMGQEFADVPQQGRLGRDRFGHGHHAGHSHNGYAEPRNGLYLTEPRGYPFTPEPIDGPAVPGREDDGSTAQAPFPVVDTDRYRVEDDTPQLDPHKHSGIITLPSRPDYDYISHNKTDYGFTPKRTYKKIREVKKREEEKLEHIFVHPKVKPKAKKGSRDSSPERPLAITHHPHTHSDPGDGTAPGPEELWAHRSAHLVQSNNATKGKQPTRRLDLNPSVAGQFRPATDSPTGREVDESSQGTSLTEPVGRWRPSQLISPIQSLPMAYPGDIIQPGPLTQHLVTEDGQRISVDVNLRLVSPPAGSEGAEYSGGHHFRHTGMQYPLPGGRSPREHVGSGGHDYSDPVYINTVSTNPYRKIPPIGSSSEGSPNSAPTHSDGSYTLTYLQNREKQISAEKPWYRIYGLKDYRRMQREVQLGRGTLGPDLESETFREKRDKMLKKMDYAKAVKEKNMKELAARMSAPHQEAQDDIMSKRRLAVEYAKNVPKPTVRPKANPYNNYELASKLSPSAKPAKRQQANQRKASVEVLDKLHKRHKEDKRSAEIIQRKAQGVAS